MGWRRRRRQPEESVEAFLDREFLVPAEVRLASEDDDGPFLPAFTSEETLHRFVPEASELMPLRGANLLLLLLESECVGVVIDPGEPDGSTISRSAAEEIVGPSFESLWSGSKIMLASPEEPPPPRFLEALQAACKRDPEVSAAYVILAAAPGGEAFPRAVLGIQLSSGEELSDELFRAIAEMSVPPADVAAAPTIYTNMDVRLLDDVLLDSVRELGILVYQRDR
jgi:SseB protein N-terminal domain/SseB protein C-terminal domain